MVTYPLLGLCDMLVTEVAKCDYEWILEGGARRSTEGLHKAFRQLRAGTRIMRKHKPLSSQPFIHVEI